jgi:hypothetical protein
MKAHDSRGPDGLRVIVGEDKPIFYIDRTYLTISLPMAPKVPPAGKGVKKKSKK